MSTDITTKALGPLEIKNEATGEVEAIIATLNVVDHDFEVITATAIKSGAKVKMSSYGHDTVSGAATAMPVGKGAVFVEDGKAIFRGKVFVTTERGRETLSVLKEMGAEQEWSFGFRIVGSEVPDEAWAKQGARLMLTKLDVFEVSPVMIGAGIGTRTLAAKEADEEARRVAQEAALVVEEADVAVKAAEDAAAEAERLAGELATAEAAMEAEATRLADEAAAETTRLADVSAQKARTAEDLEVYQRVRRALKRLGVA